ncbi:MAG: hypothetical protein AAFV53_02160 [Myxococcota bacterium]
MHDSIEAIGALLSTLEPGQRAWFWLCPGAQMPLMLSSVSDDPIGEALRTHTDEVPIPDDAFAHVGFMQVAGTGAVGFHGRTLTPTLLESLAGWVVDHAGAHPELARLSGATFFLMGTDGSMRMRYADDGLWGGLERPTPPGPLADAEQVMQEMEDGATAWLWVQAGGAGQPPQICLSPQDEDPDGKRFERQLQRLARRARRTDQQVRGLLVRVDGLPMVVTTASPTAIRRWLPFAARRLQGQYPMLGQLSGALVMRPSDEGDFEIHPMVP